MVKHAGWALKLLAQESSCKGRLNARCLQHRTWFAVGRAFIWDAVSFETKPLVWEVNQRHAKHCFLRCSMNMRCLRAAGQRFIHLCIFWSKLILENFDTCINDLSFSRRFSAQLALGCLSSLRKCALLIPRCVCVCVSGWGCSAAGSRKTGNGGRKEWREEGEVFFTRTQLASTSTGFTQMDSAKHRSKILRKTKMCLHWAYANLFLASIP